MNGLLFRSRLIFRFQLPTLCTFPDVSKLSLAEFGGERDFVLGNDPTGVVEFRHFDVEIQGAAFRHEVLKMRHKTVGVVFIMLIEGKGGGLGEGRKEKRIKHDRM